MDVITGIGAVGRDGGNDGNGIVNAKGALISTGNDADTITGEASAEGGYGIVNDGLIATGFGMDTVSAIKGGFSGSGTIELGADNDTLIGFGTGTFRGQLGLGDQILLGEGSYVIAAAGFLSFTISSGGDQMNVDTFEWIGGVNGGNFALAAGTLNVDVSGVATFVS